LSNAMCAEGTNSDTCPNTCASLGRGYTQFFVRAHDLGKPKTMGSFRSNQICRCSFTFVPHTSSVETRNSQKLPCEKTNFRSWRNRDKLQIVNFKFNLNIVVMFIFNSFMNCNVFVLVYLSFACCFLRDRFQVSFFSIPIQQRKS